MIDRRITASFRLRWQMVFIPLLLFATLASSPLARADSKHDMLVFLSLERHEIFSSSDPELEGFETPATSDFLYTYNSDRFRFLAEYIWSSSENELERFQGAWQIDDATMLWVGRYHAISKYWTTEYHHGQFMQTSISRPGVEEWEDDGGPMPSHITGLWLDRDYSIKERSAINLGLSTGLAPKFAAHGLVPFDFLNPESGHEFAVSGRLVYRPDILSMNQFGLSLAYNDIAVEPELSPILTDLNSIRQATFAVFSDWWWEDWRLSTNWVYFDMDLRYRDGGTVGEDFILGYVQGEYEATENWTVFGRSELGIDEDDSLYLQLLSEFVARRNMIGVRWDFADSQALTMEAAETSALGDDFSHDRFKELRIQWSAVFP